MLFIRLSLSTLLLAYYLSSLVVPPFLHEQGDLDYYRRRRLIYALPLEVVNSNLILRVNELERYIISIIGIQLT